MAFDRFMNLVLNLCLISVIILFLLSWIDYVLLAHTRQFVHADR